MADIKQMSFMLLVLLVSVSGLYEWAQSQPVLAEDLGVGNIDDFNSTNLTNDLNSLQIATNDIFTTNIITEFSSYLNALGTFFTSVWGIFMKLMFGWSSLVSAIFTAIGLEGIDVIFIAPLAIIQILASFYFLRDLVNTVRGVGGA